MKRTFPLILIFALALGLRWLYLTNLEAYPRFERIQNRLDDQVVFDRWARSIVGGERFDYGESGHEFAYWAALSPGVYPQSPLYPFFVATCYRLLGARPDAVRAVQMVLGAAACALLYLVARRFVSGPTAVLCGLAAAFYGPFVFYEGTFLRAGLFTFVAVTCLWFLLLAGEATPRQRRWRLPAVGLALASGVLLRPNFLLVVVLATIWCFLTWRRAGDSPAQAWRSIRQMLIVVALPLLLIAGVNTWRSGQLAFLSSNGPYIFFIGNVHDAEGISAGASLYYQQVKASAPAEEIHLLREALADIARHPVAFVELQGRKALAFFSAVEIPNNLNFALARELNPHLRWAGIEFYLLLPLALIGFGISLRRPWQHSLLYLFVGGYWVATVAFYVLSRLRQPVVPVLLIFAGIALEAGWRRARTDRWPQAVVAALFVLVATVWLQPPAPSHRPTDYQMAAAAYVSEARELEVAGQMAPARRRYARAVALNPDYEEAVERLAFLDRGREPGLGPEISALCEEARRSTEEGDLKTAIERLERAAELAPDSGLPYRYLSNVYYLAGDRRRAMLALEEAIEREPLAAIDRNNLKRLRLEVARAGPD